MFYSMVLIDIFNSSKASGLGLEAWDWRTEAGWPVSGLGLAWD